MTNHLRRGPWFGWVLSLFALLGCAHSPTSSARRPEIRVSVFQSDITPPLGHPLCGGWIKPLEKIDDPLLAKGIILEQGDQRYVVCAIDWCLLQNGAHDLFVKELAEAAGVPVKNVSVHTVHQHNAPIADLEAQLLLATFPGAPQSVDLVFLTNVTRRLGNAAHASLLSMQPVTGISFGQAKVEKFASTRRVRLADGQIHVRYSSTKDPELMAAPEGLIDPLLRTVSFLQAGKPIVRLHFYATHPMSYYGDGRATSDTVGLAREQLEREEGIPQIYFTGCGGNITPGKYNDGSPKARFELTARIHDAMRRAIVASTITAASDLNWATTEVGFGPRTEPEWSEDASRRTLASSKASKAERVSAAFNLAWIQRARNKPKIQISRLSVGSVSLLFLPGESFIEYQLYAQSLRPGEHLAVAAYGQSGPGYICCDASLAEGGYEPTDSRVGPPTEWNLKDGIARLLGGAAFPSSNPFYPDKLHLLVWRSADGYEHRIEKRSDWVRRRTHILESMQEVMDPLPADTNTVLLTIKILEETRLENCVRQKIVLTVEPGNDLPAYLFVPTDLHARLPALVCLHQTTPAGKAEPAGVSGESQFQYALELARRGYITLAPDYPGFGDYQRDPYVAGYRSVTMQAIVNHRRTIDYLVSRSDVDPARIGVVGHSLGGHNALFLAAFDQRVQAVITSCGFDSFYKYHGGDLKSWGRAKYMPSIQTNYGCDPKQMPFDFTEVLAAIAPRAVFINAPLHDTNFELSGVKDCLSAAAPVYQLLGATDNLFATHPDSGHEFPLETRQAAYRWLDQKLSHQPPR